jgi:pyridoxal phosphate enzyme (YggS family)
MSFDYIKDNYSHLKHSIKEVCTSGGRDFNSITLIAVSKTFSPEEILVVNKEGHTDFGENKVQELLKKYEELKDTNIKWHLIGRLQTNKVKYIAEFVHLIHSVDSIKLAKEIDRQGGKAARVINVLVQVNTSGEESKSGIEPGEAAALCAETAKLRNVRLKGLMTIGALTGDRDIIRANFKTLKRLYDELKPLHPDFEFLSMGMTSDYDIALEEGSNMLRVGSAIFGKRIY